MTFRAGRAQFENIERGDAFPVAGEHLREGERCPRSPSAAAMVVGPGSHQFPRGFHSGWSKWSP